jgi:hypothetical protein
MTESAETSLCHDLIFLRYVASEAVRLHPGRTPEDRVTLGVLRDYFTWLTFDAVTDEGLARRLVRTIARLQEELYAEAENNHARDRDPTAPAFYEGFLHGLEQSISFSHGVDLLLDEEIDREEFKMIWRQAKERLGL